MRLNGPDYKTLHTGFFILAALATAHALAGASVTTSSAVQAVAALQQDAIQRDAIQQTVAQRDKQLQIELSQGGINHLATSDMFQRYGEETLAIDDPHYGERRTYRGVDLRDLLRDQGFAIGEQLILECTDGYEIPFDTTVLEHADLEALVAFSDLKPTEGSDFKLYQHGRELVDFSPFYLIWKDDSQQLETEAWDKLPWPYSLVRIRRAGDFAPAPPAADAEASVHAGYATYVDHCVKCHKIDDRGGQLGPQLDRNPGMLRVLSDDQALHLITQVSDFFPGSKMPIFKDILEEEQARDLVSYLRWMLALPAPMQMPPEQQPADSR
ncbi:MAG: cytochrome c [Pseudomonadota bacterium]